MLDNVVIVRVDGGICSQVEFVALGLYLSRRFNVKIKYDLSWFEKVGKDINGVFVRNWDMPKAFPGFALEVAGEDEILRVRRTGSVCETLEECLALCERGVSVYICGYPDRLPALTELREEFRVGFSPVVEGDSLTLLNEVTRSNSCAVHVRRGDLSTYINGYGRPATVKYFQDAMKIVSALHPETRFYIFSDEPDWVRENIIRCGIPERPCKLCDVNGSDKGYLDLFLMSRCRRIVSSHGSMGVLAAFLSPDIDLLVTSSDRGPVTDILGRVICVRDGREKGESAAPQRASEAVAIRVRRVRKDGWRKPLYKVYKKIQKWISV